MSCGERFHFGLCGSGSVGLMLLYGGISPTVEVIKRSVFRVEEVLAARYVVESLL